MENNIKIATSGNQGDKVKSDCFIQFELTQSGGIILEINSKVKSLYGESIKKLCLEILSHFDVHNAKLIVNDAGALPFVLAARIETCIKQLITTTKEYLLPLIEENKYTTSHDKFRFSRLYLPGNTPNFMINAGIHKPDGIILDLEDSVAALKKSEARYLVRNALRQVDFYSAERMVRINQVPMGIEDLEFIVPHYVNLILVPKCEDPKQIIQVEDQIKRIKEQNSLEYPIWLMPIIESALGVEKAYEIATSSQNIVALAVGLEDLTADYGVKRTKEGTETLYARTRIVNACKAAGISPIDSVFSDVADMDGLVANVKASKALGFEGMGCIHPRQIKVIHDNYAPEPEEVEKAKQIISAFIEAKGNGLGVVSLGTKMIDAPVVKRAEKTIDLAIKTGLLGQNWRENIVTE